MVDGRWMMGDGGCTSHCIRSERKMCCLGKQPQEPTFHPNPPSPIPHPPSLIPHQPSTIDHRPSTINHQPSAISLQSRARPPIMPRDGGSNPVLRKPDI